MARILLIDDDEAFRSMLRLMLGKMGHQVTEARDGREGVRCFEQEPPELVMTDIVMPDGDGLEAIGAFHDRFPEIKIIAMSGGGRVSSTDYLKMARALGADAVLAKPFSKALLEEVLRKVLYPNSSSSAACA